VRGPAKGTQQELTPKEGMGGVGDFDLGHLIKEWVIE